MTRILSRCTNPPAEVHMITDIKGGLMKTKCGATSVMLYGTAWHTDVTCWDCLAKMNTAETT